MRPRNLASKKCIITGKERKGKFTSAYKRPTTSVKWRPVLTIDFSEKIVGYWSDEKVNWRCLFCLPIMGRDAKIF